ncbi:Hypothetical predicted protein [Scomber scombrus]|uniref:Transcriptional regulator n=1 Tax=Scomber scombrus TaxID=13677 RepID=A0AAV1NWU1_SCOSC
MVISQRIAKEAWLVTVRLWWAGMRKGELASAFEQRCNTSRQRLTGASLHSSHCEADLCTLEMRNHLIEWPESNALPSSLFYQATERRRIVEAVAGLVCVCTELQEPESLDHPRVHYIWGPLQS